MTNDIKNSLKNMFNTFNEKPRGMSIIHTSDDCCIFSVCCVDGSPMFPGSFVCLKHCCCVHGVTLTHNVTNLVVAGFWEQDLSLGVLSSGNQEDGENHQTPGDEPKRHVDCQNELCC